MFYIRKRLTRDKITKQIVAKIVIKAVSSRSLTVLYIQRGVSYFSRTRQLQWYQPDAHVRECKWLNPSSFARVCVCVSPESPLRPNSISRRDIIAANDKISISRREAGLWWAIYARLHAEGEEEEKTRFFFSLTNTYIHRGSFIRYNTRFIGDIGARGHRLSMSNQHRGRGQLQGKGERKDVKKKMRQGKSALFRQTRFKRTLSLSLPPPICSSSIR